MPSITNFSYTSWSESRKQRAKMLSSGAYARALVGRVRGSSVGAYPDTIPLDDSIRPRSGETIEVPDEPAAAAASSRQGSDEPAVLEEQANRAFYFVCKRCADVCLASAILLLLLPVFVLIAMLIKLDSRGP